MPKYLFFWQNITIFQRLSSWITLVAKFYPRSISYILKACACVQVAPFPFYFLFISKISNSLIVSYKFMCIYSYLYTELFFVIEIICIVINHLIHFSSSRIWICLFIWSFFFWNAVPF